MFRLLAIQSCLIVYTAKFCVADRYSKSLDLSEMVGKLTPVRGENAKSNKRANQ